MIARTRSLCKRNPKKRSEKSCYQPRRTSANGPRPGLRAPSLWRRFALRHSHPSPRWVRSCYARTVGERLSLTAITHLRASVRRYRRAQRGGRGADPGQSRAGPMRGMRPPWSLRPGEASRRVSRSAGPPHPGAVRVHTPVDNCQRMLSLDEQSLMVRDSGEARPRQLPRDLASPPGDIAMDTGEGPCSMHHRLCQADTGSPAVLTDVDRSVSSYFTSIASKLSLE
jgi:hypothetical protein